MKNFNVALIDADLIVMRIACRFDKFTGVFPDDIDGTPASLEVDPSQAKEAEEAADEFIQTEIMSRLVCNHYLLCFTGGGNWRKQLFPEVYKQNRKDKVSPPLRTYLTNYLMANHPSLRVHELEADDLLGILQTEAAAKGRTTVLCSIDKDLLQIPGWHFNWNELSGVHQVTEAAARHFHWVQTLTGDPTDGYSGCRGIGKKRAAAILDSDAMSEQEAWSRIVTAYEQAGMTEAEALANARMARILRYGEFQMKPKRRVKLWLPFQEQEEWKEL